MSIQQKMVGKRVLVTGSGTGIGREIALEFARNGADVAVHYSHASAGAQSAVQEMLEWGVRAKAFHADFTEGAQAKGLANDAAQFLGGLDCLINNAGITFNHPFLDVTAEQHDQMYAVNVRAPFLITQIAVEQMLRQSGGTICNIASIHGIAGARDHSVYAGTKGAIIASTRALAVELAHQGIRVNAIAPGWVTVESYFAAIPGFNEVDAKKSATEKVPLGRSGQPLEIAKLALFLCSDDASYIVGQTIIADGGTTALMSLLSDFRTRSTAQFGVGYLPGL